MINHPNDIWDYIKDYNGIDQYLTKHWQYWDLVKFVAGYERWNVGEHKGIEEYGEYYIIPQTLKMFGFSPGYMGIRPAPTGAGIHEYAISSPDYIASGLTKHFGSDAIAIAPGNLIMLYSAKEGLIKDGIKELYSFYAEWLKGFTIPYEGIKLYLMK